ncbi:hypothetical protein [Flavobacterium sp. I3-2]|uniref:hypothetical protein n=1 Tax=Flavobacterium sp. I3-2 TaxID=2748319 RepID=UPI0015ABB849|nr:hypothetical protein [Flavobacterium sp. I3-2]
MKTKIKFISAFCFILGMALTSCSSGVEYSIDNPTDQAIKITIDENEAITIEPKTLKTIEGKLEKGKHSMQVEGGEKIDFNLEDDKVMLNPTLSSYIRLKQEYGMGFQSTLKDTTIIINNEKYTAPIINVSKDPVIKLSDINFSVNEPYPDEVETYSNGTVVKIKLFREGDFVKYYDEN